MTASRLPWLPKKNTGSLSRTGGVSIWGRVPQVTGGAVRLWKKRSRGSLMSSGEKASHRWMTGTASAGSSGQGWPAVMRLAAAFF